MIPAKLELLKCKSLRGDGTSWTLTLHFPWDWPRMRTANPDDPNSTPVPYFAYRATRRFYEHKSGRIWVAKGTYFYPFVFRWVLPADRDFVTFKKTVDEKDTTYIFRPSYWFMSFISWATTPGDNWYYDTPGDRPYVWMETRVAPEFRGIGLNIGRLKLGMILTRRV